MSNAEYDRLAAPSTIQSIPADLANPNLEYSGIFEDGWVGRESYAQLSGGPSGRLMIRADVLARPGGQRLQVLVNGKTLCIPAGGSGIARSRPPATGLLRPAEDELRWAGVTRLAAPDRRSAAARLTFLSVG